MCRTKDRKRGSIVILVVVQVSEKYFSSRRLFFLVETRYFSSLLKQFGRKFSIAVANERNFNERPYKHEQQFEESGWEILSLVSLGCEENSIDGELLKRVERNLEYAPEEFPFHCSHYKSIILLHIMRNFFV